MSCGLRTAHICHEDSLERNLTLAKQSQLLLSGAAKPMASRPCAQHATRTLRRSRLQHCCHQSRIPSSGFLLAELLGRSRPEPFPVFRVSRSGVCWLVVLHSRPCERTKSIGNGSIRDASLFGGKLA